MERTEVIASVAGDLHATEHAIDAAITQATTLVQSFIGARAALSLSPVAATASQAKAMETIAALAAFRHGLQVFVDDEHFHAGVGVADRDEAEFAFARGSFGIPSIEGAGNREFRRAVEILCGRVRRRLNEALYDL